MKLIMENWREYIKEELDDEAGHDDGFDTEDLIEWIGGYTMVDEPGYDRHPDDKDLLRIKGLIEKFKDKEISTDASGDYRDPRYPVDEIIEHWNAAVASKRDNSIAAIAEKEVELLPKLESYKVAREGEDEQGVVAIEKEIIDTLRKILKKLQGLPLTTRENNL